MARDPKAAARMRLWRARERQQLVVIGPTAYDPVSLEILATQFPALEEALGHKDDLKHVIPTLIDEFACVIERSRDLKRQRE